MHDEGISQHDEVANMSQWHKLMSSPAQFKDSVTGELVNILADSVGPPIILADKDDKTKAAEYKKHQIAMLQVLFRRAGPDWLNLAKLIHGSGEWYGWNSKAEVTLSTHPWLREYDELAERYLMQPPRKKHRDQLIENMLQTEENFILRKKLKTVKKKLQTELRKELRLYFQETMDFMDISPEGFALCAAQGKKLYAWMAELLKTDPDCTFEMQLIKCDLDFMTTMVDLAMYKARKEVVASKGGA